MMLSGYNGFFKLQELAAMIKPSVRDQQSIDRSEEIDQTNDQSLYLNAVPLKSTIV